MGLGKRYRDFIPDSTRRIIDTKGRDPLAHYLDSGKPSGTVELSKLFSPGQYVIAEKSLKVALHLHLYYQEMAEEILERLGGFVAEWISSLAFQIRWQRKGLNRSSLRAYFARES